MPLFCFGGITALLGRLATAYSSGPSRDLDCVVKEHRFTDTRCISSVSRQVVNRVSAEAQLQDFVQEVLMQDMTI